jgi:hypothetical protein
LRPSSVIHTRPASTYGFRSLFQCCACGWLTEYVKLQAVAEKLWNEAKKPE